MGKELQFFFPQINLLTVKQPQMTSLKFFIAMPSKPHHLVELYLITIQSTKFCLEFHSYRVNKMWEYHSIPGVYEVKMCLSKILCLIISMYHECDSFHIVRINQKVYQRRCVEDAITELNRDTFWQWKRLFLLGFWWGCSAPS